MKQQRLETLARIYQDVDDEAARLTTVHAARLRCGRGCWSCCVDELTVFEVEAENIRRHHGALLREGTPHAEGACAFWMRRVRAVSIPTVPTCAEPRACRFAGSTKHRREG